MATPYIAVDCANSTVWRDLVRVKGSSGTLTGLGVSGGPCYHRVRVTIDGVVLAEDALAGTNSSAHASNGIGVGLPFEDDMVVEMCDDAVASAVARFWAAYVTDQSQEIARHTYVIDVDGRAFRYERVNYLRDDRAGEYTVATSIGPALVAEVRLAHDVIVPAEWEQGDAAEFELNGEVVLWDHRDGTHSFEPEVNVSVRPAGRATPVATLPVPPVEGVTTFAEEVRLRRGRDYEAVTDLRGYANVPASFLVT